MSTARRGRRLPEGIRLRHGRRCASGGGGACDCSPSYQAVVRARDGRKLRKSFRGLGDAIAWRDEMRVGVRKRTVVSPTSLTFHEYAEQWLEGVRSGTNLTRDLAAYKPSTVRAYAKHIKRIYPALGSMRLSAIELHDLQDEANRLIASGLTPSSVRNTFDPVRKIFARAVREHLIAINPTVGLELKAKDGGRSWVDRPERVARALAALDDVDRGPWTVAFYAGLRAGEIQALRWADVDFDRGVLRVERSWDRKAGPISAQEPRRASNGPDVDARASRATRTAAALRAAAATSSCSAALPSSPSSRRYSTATARRRGATRADLEWAADGM